MKKVEERIVRGYLCIAEIAGDENRLVMEPLSSEGQSLVRRSGCEAESRDIQICRKNRNDHVSYITAHELRSGISFADCCW